MTAPRLCTFVETLCTFMNMRNAAPPASPGQLNAAAMAGAVIADVAREKNLSLEEMQAKGLGADEIEALLTKQKLAATARIAHHKEGEAEARKDAALAAKRLGALAYLTTPRRRLPLTPRLPNSIPTIGKRSGISGRFKCEQATLKARKPPSSASSRCIQH